MSTKLSQQERRALLDLAREAICRSVCGEKVAMADLSQVPPLLAEERASFVTLTGPGGELRGCIGTVEAHMPLAHDVQRNAMSSALRDPRFPPVTPDELDDLEIELSILTPPQGLAFESPEDLLRKIRPGVDGIIIEKDWRRATLLPSVWEKITDPVQFLETLCYKAGLPDDAWRRSGLTVSVYQAEKIKTE
jgi:AmmeMemoRadiSam system protein A